MKFKKKINGIVYAIVNTYNGRRYIGSTLLGNNRRGQHLSKLRRGKHHCKNLQKEWNEYGGDKFIYEVIENVKVECVRDILTCEQKWIDCYKFSCYNSSKIPVSSYGWSKSKIKMMDWDRNVIKIYDSAWAVRFDGFSPSCVSSVSRKYYGGVHKGHKWARVSKLDIVNGFRWSPKVSECDRIQLSSQ